MTIRVVPGEPASPVRLSVGAQLVAEFPPNPVGTWTAPSVTDRAVVSTSVTRSAAGMTLVITGLAPGRAAVTVVTTPTGDPRPPGRTPQLRWILPITVA